MFSGFGEIMFSVILETFSNVCKPRLDNVSSIQQSSALALGRLANYSDELAESVVTHEILPQLVYSLSQQNRFYKKAAAFVLRAVAKHSPQLAQAVFDVYCGDDPISPVAYQSFVDGAAAL